MKFSVFLNAFILSLFAPFVAAELLFYEPFDYPAGTEIDGQMPALGAGSAWTDTSSGDGTPNATPSAAPLTVRANGTNGGATSGQTWTGIPSSSTFPNTGGYLEGLRRDNNEGHISLASSVTSQFTDGSTIWLSYVTAATTVDGVNDNHHEPTLAIGAGAFGGDEAGGNGGDDRARISLGEAVGAGSKFNNAMGEVEAMYWDDEAAADVFTQFFTDVNLPRITPQQLIVVRIEFSSESEIITTNVFSLDPFSDPVPSVTDFETGAVSITTPGNLDQSSFNTLMFDGVRTNLDEIRIATTFDDVISGSNGGGAAKLVFTEITHSDVDGSVTITWKSRPGVEYVVEAASTLNPTVWIELSDSEIGDMENDTTSYTEFIEDGFGLTADTIRRFYRVRG